MTEYLRLSRLYNPLNLSPASKDLECRSGSFRGAASLLFLKKSRFYLRSLGLPSPRTDAMVAGRRTDEIWLKIGGGRTPRRGRCGDATVLDAGTGPAG